MAKKKSQPESIRRIMASAMSAFLPINQHWMSEGHRKTPQLPYMAWMASRKSRQRRISKGMQIFVSHRSIKVYILSGWEPANTFLFLNSREASRCVCRRFERQRVRSILRFATEKGQGFLGNSRPFYRICTGGRIFEFEFEKQFFFDDCSEIMSEWYKKILSLQQLILFVRQHGNMLEKRGMNMCYEMIEINWRKTKIFWLLENIQTDT